MNEELTVNINSEAVDKVENALTIMAEKLGVASDHFYPIVVKQQLIEGWIYTITAIPVLSIAIFFMFITYIEGKKGNESIEWFLGSIICYGIFITIVGLNLSQIINPEYYALMEIKSFIK